jgi:hypothetical protein
MSNMSRVYELLNKEIAKLGRQATPDDEDALIEAVWPKLTESEKKTLALKYISLEIEKELGPLH